MPFAKPTESIAAAKTAQRIGTAQQTWLDDLCKVVQDFALNGHYSAGSIPLSVLVLFAHFRIGFATGLQAQQCLLSQEKELQRLKAEMKICLRQSSTFWTNLQYISMSSSTGDQASTKRSDTQSTKKTDKTSRLKETKQKKSEEESRSPLWKNRLVVNLRKKTFVTDLAHNQIKQWGKLAGSSDSLIEVVVAAVLQDFDNIPFLCKLEQILQSDTFKIRICAADELVDMGVQATAGQHSSKTNILSILWEECYSPSYVRPYLGHELQHAFIYSQNMRRYQPFLKERAYGYRHIPCFFDQKKIDCTELVGIRERSMHKIREILKLLQDPKPELFTAKQHQQIADYKKWASAYKPLELVTFLTPKEIQQFQKAGLIDTAYKIKKPGVYPRLKVNTQQQPIIYNIQWSPSAGLFSASVRSCTIQEQSKAPVLDLFWQLESRKESNQKGNPFYEDLDEFDAIVHQILGDTPELLKFLCEGLAEYHEKRSDQSYHACLRL